MALPRLFRPPFGEQPENIQEDLHRWFLTEVGQSVLQSEKAILDQILPSAFGYHLVQLSSAGDMALIDQSRIRNKRVFSRQLLPNTSVCTDVHQLPLADSSVDVMLLHHSLDFERDPYAVLREATRVVIPGGRIIVVGFNPWSLWGLFRLFQLKRRELPWAARYINPYRVSDWLQVLNFSVQGYESGLYTLPFKQEHTHWLNVLGSRFWPQRGAFYVLMARKVEMQMMPMKPKKSVMKPRLMQLPVAQRNKNTGDL